MNPIGLIDLLALLATLTASILLWRGWKRALGRDSRLLLTGLLALGLFHSLSNALEWSGITAALDPLEDYVQLLLPLLWGFFFYAFLQELARGDLRKSEQLRKKTVASLREALLILDANIPPTILDCNPAATQMFGYTRQELLGRSADLVHVDPAALKEFQEHLYPAIQEHGFLDLPKFSMKRKDGTVFASAHSVVPLTDEQDRRIGWVSVVRDISERVRAEKERERLLVAEREQRELAETLREVAGALNSSLNREQVLQLILEQLSRVVAYDSASVVLLSGDRLDIVAQRGLRSEQQMLLPLQFNDLAHTREVLQDCVARTIPDTTTDARWRPVAGAEYIRSWLGVPLRVKDRAIGMLSLDKEQPNFYSERDAELVLAFADQAATAIENAHLYNDLQQQIKEQQRTQAQLIQSAKLAAIGELAAGVAHELNNPLTTVLGFSEVLLDELGPDIPWQEDLTAIASEARRARDIIRNLLDFARQTPPRRQRTDLNEIVQQTLRVIRYHIEKSGVVIEEDYAELDFFSLDEGQIKQVLLNLIGNAAQAMPKGGTLSLRTARIGDEVAVSVSDTGEGISPEDQDRIFDPFFTTKPGGTGLGLSVSLGIVQEHGGRITVENQEGQGSTFTVWLPVV